MTDAIDTRVADLEGLDNVGRPQAFRFQFPDLICRDRPRSIDADSLGHGDILELRRLRARRSMSTLIAVNLDVIRRGFFIRVSPQRLDEA